MASQIERTRQTHQHFKDWISLNRPYIGDSTLDEITIYMAFLAGWMAGHKAALDDQMEQLQT